MNTQIEDIESGKDGRYTVTLEYVGHKEPRYVARFCDQWVGCASTKEQTIQLNVTHYKNRMSTYHESN